MSGINDRAGEFASGGSLGTKIANHPGKEPAKRKKDQLRNNGGGRIEELENRDREGSTSGGYASFLSQSR
jgi:hypothetical protein